MKKLLSAAVATAMVASLTVPAFAATDLTTSPAENQGAGDYAIGVEGTYQAGAAAAEKVSVDIAWESMDFTYSKGKGVYNAENHTTTYPDASWSDNKAAITVTNHSNTEVTATFSFDKADGVTTTGTFYTKSGENYTKIESAADQKFILESAEGKAITDGPTDSLHFGVSGDGIAAEQKLGTITIAIAGPKWTTVDSEESLKNALEAGGYIRLDANIELTDYINCYSATATLDLNGHTISQFANEKGVLFVHENYTLTVQDTAGGGKITAAEYTIGVRGTLYVKGGTIVSSGTYAVYMNGNGKTTISGGVLFAQGSDSNGVNATKDSELTITGGTITGSSAVKTAGKTTITGGTLTASSTRALNFTNDTGESLTITGGTFNGKCILYGSAATITGGTFNGKVENWIDGLTISGGTFTGLVDNNAGKTLTISDGTFTGEIDNSGTIAITGGTFVNDPTDYVPTTGHEVTQNPDDTYTVWQIASDWDTLVSALTAGGYVKLTADISASATATLSSPVSAILDLNGRSVTTTVATLLTLSDGYSLTVFDSVAFTAESTGKLTSSDVVPQLIKVGKGGTLTVNGGTLDAGNYGTTVYAEESSTVTVNGGTIIGAAPIKSHGSVTIKAGTLKNTENVKATIYQYKGTLIISGGTVDGTLSFNTGVTFIITGGTFVSSDPAGYVPDGYTVTNNGDGTYTVTKNDN